MKVSQIKEDAKQVLRLCEDVTLYNRLTQAVEVLATEGQWDSLQAYMDIIVDPNGIVTLPRDVLAPIKININNHPAFSHDKLYEFTLNGPGNDMAETSGWAWMDKGRVPVSMQPNNNTVIAFCQSPADVGKKVRIFGYDYLGRECTDELSIVLWNTTNPTRSPNFYKKIVRVDKDITIGQIGLYVQQDEVPPSPVPPPGPPPPPPPPPPTIQVEDPVLDPVPGSYERNGGAISVTITDRTPDATMIYTTDGTTPTRENGRIIVRGIGRITLRLPPPETEGDISLFVFAYKDGLLDSHVVGGVYHISPTRGGPGISTPDDILPQLLPKQPPPKDPVPVPPEPDPNAVLYLALATYYADEIAPSYRQIKLAKNATAIRMLYRRRTYQITTDDDWIPLDSTMAILTMLKALEAIRNGAPEELQKVDMLYKQALHFLQQEQVMRMQFAMDAQKEIPATLAITYGYGKGQTGLVAADLKADAMQIIGNCEDTTFYNRLTHAIEVLSHEGQWDSLQSYMDLSVIGLSSATLPAEETGVVTLPRDVLMPIKININDNPAFSRAKLYEFTLNGPGSDMQDTVGWNWMDKGDVVVTRQPDNAPLVALCENLQDIGKKVTVWGYDTFGRECSDELMVTPMNLTPIPTASINFYSRITKVKKEVTTGQVALFSSVTPPLPPPPPTGTNPSFSPPPGTYQRQTAISVTIATTTPDGILSYTTDGTTPTQGHGTIVPGPAVTIRISLPPPQVEGVITLKAMVFRVGLPDSPVVTGLYTLNPSPTGVTPETPNPTTPDTPQFLPDDFDNSVLAPPELIPHPPPPPEFTNILAILAVYYPDEVEPRYRQIRLTGYPETIKSIRMLYRRKTYQITSDSDWIPLNSRMAILTMMRGLEALRDGRPEEIQKADVYQKQAIHYLQQEQAMRNNFDLAAKSENPRTLNLGIYNADSVIVADVYDEACEIFGPIGRSAIFDKITDAREFLANQGQWDGLTGYVDLLTDNHYWITLPRYIENVVSLNINRSPKMFRNKWFEFHLNGPGTQMTACDYWDDAGETVTLRPLYNIIQPVAYSNLSTDIGKVVIIHGLDDMGVPIRSQWEGQWIDGIRVRCTQPGIPPLKLAQKISRIDRIIKEPSDGFIQLWGYERAHSVGTTDVQQRAVPLGFYYPDETEPNYRRIKLPQKATWVRMRYRLRSLKVSSLGDPLQLKNRLAITTAMRALKALEGDPSKAEALETKAINYLLAEQSSRNPSETFSVQFSGLDSAETII